MLRWLTFPLYLAQLFLHLLISITATLLQTIFPKLTSHVTANFNFSIRFSTMSLRVKKLTLFSHGMACIDHAASVSGNATLTLSLPPNHMNDVLKTLSVIDEGGVIESVTYDAPATNRDDIGQQDVLCTLIRESQGAQVVIDHERGSVRGRLVGLQDMTAPGGAGLLASVGHAGFSNTVVVLEEDGGIVSRNLSQMTKLRFIDTILQELLQRRMKQCALGAQARKNKVITIATRGEEERLVRATYAVESPVYKVTYRFLLREDTVFVQAWAIVDNPSEEDLEDVEVVIVSGLPISFRHDLYNARYISRPVQHVPTHAGTGAPSRQLQKDGAFRGARMKKMSRHTASALDDDAMDMAMVCPPAPEATASVRQQAEAQVTPKWTPAAEAAAAGSVHEYRVRERVTIRARESALLPLVMSTCDGGRVDVYSYDIRATNTLRAVKIRNETPAPFEAGPVAVYDDERLVGEGMLHACRPGKEELVPYCVNLECVVERVISQGRGGVVECIAVSGNFIVKRSVEKVTRYEFRAQADAVDVIVMHELTTGYDRPSALVLPAGEETAATENGLTLDPMSTEDGVARYRVQITAGGTASLRVTESRLESVRREIRGSCTAESIAYLRREGMVGKAAAERMRKVMEAQGELAKVQAEIGVLEGTTRGVEKAQARYRENVVAVGGGQGRVKDSGFVSEFVRRIRESETRIEELRAEIEQKRETEKELVEKILEMVAEFDKKSALV